MILRALWNSKGLLAFLILVGAGIGAMATRFQTPSYRIEYVLTPASQEVFNKVRLPFMRTALASPLFSSVFSSGGGLLGSPPDSDRLFTDYMRQVRSLAALSAIMRSPETATKASEYGVDPAHLTKMHDELIATTRMVNLGLNWERTKVVFTSSNPPFIQYLADRVLRVTGKVVWDDVNQVLKDRIQVVSELIQFRLKYLEALKKRRAENLYYAALLDVEHEYLQGDVIRVKEILNTETESIPLCTIEGNGPTISLLKPKLWVNLFIGAVMSLILATWAILWKDRKEILNQITATAARSL